MKLLRILLLPFSWLYGFIMRLRNLLYDQGFFQATEFNLPVIGVGNLTVGGTGKTPHVEFLIRLLKGKKLATLSRGYKRKSKGFLLANTTVSAETLGDEPYQYYLDFPEITVAVCEKRVEGIQKIQQLKPETEVIILDDAFQHRAVKPKLNLLITDFYRRFDTDRMLPSGLLREPRSGAKRADAVIVSKCPENLTQEQKNDLKNGIGKYIKPGTPVFFTTYAYGNLVNFGLTQALHKAIILVTGIANAEPLLAYLKAGGFSIREHLAFPDHHPYTPEDLEKIAKTWQKEQTSGGGCSILTTRKDAVKLARPEFASVLQGLPFFYVPIEVAFLENQAAFENLVLNTAGPEV
jgi:tetraacyldisaccharide 4'-kinase